MTLLGRELPLGLEVQEVFNPSTVQMMLSAQLNYVNAMREDYLRGLLEYKDFKKQYGDFYSPFLKDNENWYNITQKPIQDLMRQYGPGLLRSKDGLALIENTIANVDYGALARIKAGVGTGNEYLKSMGELDRKGQFNLDYENYLLQQLGLKPFDQWDTLKDGVWRRPSPSKFESLTEVSDPVYEGMKETDHGSKDRYRYSGINEDDLMKVAGDRIQYLKNDPLGGYYYKKSLDAMRLKYPGLSSDEVQRLANEDFLKQVAQSLNKRLHMNSKADEYALEKFRTDEGIREHTANKATDAKYAKLGAGTGNGNDRTPKFDIFKDAIEKGKGGVVNYMPSRSDALRISPKPGYNIKANYKDGGLHSYTISGRHLNKVLFTKNSIYSKSAPVHLNGINIDPNKDYYYQPYGQMHAKKDSKGNIRYFISGTIVENKMQKDQNGNPLLDDKGNVVYTQTPVKFKNRTNDFQLEVEQNYHEYNTNNTVE